MHQDAAQPLLLRVEHLTKRFGTGETIVTAVDDVSMAVAAGEVLLIMGPSGSGKSTLLSMLGALLRPTDGNIVIDELDIAGLSERRLPGIRLRYFGFVFQDFNLLSALTALENVALVAELAGRSPAEARQQARELLREFGLDKRLHHRPDQLSGGEKQRVALARALINDPTLVLADEPTANLDSRIGREVMRLLQGIARTQGRGVVIVSHDERIKEIADRVLWMEDGRVQEIAALLIDPVCGMAVDPARAVTAEFNGVTLAFCSRGCREEFFEDPDHIGGGHLT